jgi:hypothetical protein
MRRKRVLGPGGAARAVEWVIGGAAALAGAWFSYDFGVLLGGPLMGVVVAINGAAMCSLLASALLDRLAAARGPR